MNKNVFVQFFPPKYLKVQLSIEIWILNCMVAVIPAKLL